MKLKKIGIGLVAMMLVLFTAQAQPPERGEGFRGGPGGPGGMRGQMMGQLAGIEGADKESWVEARTARMIKKLKLNEDQASQLTALYGQNFESLQAIQAEYGPTIASMREEMMAAREENMGDRESMRASMMEIRGKYEEELAVVQESLKGMRETNKEELELILTEEQFEDFEKMQNRQRENPGRRRPN